MRLPANASADERPVLDSLHRGVDRESRLVNRTGGVRVEYDRRTRTLRIAGEVESVAAKRLFLRRARAAAPDERLVDELRVAPAQPMEDGEIRAHLGHALLAEPAFQECVLRQFHKGAYEDLARPEPARAELSLRVEDGVVWLEGTAPSLSHQRLAGVLAWWIPGVRDVRNRLAVVPPEEDNDGELGDAVYLVLDKDPLVDRTGIQIQVQDGVVTLRGLVPKQGEREIAERDAWYVEGVEDVRNELEVVKSKLSS